MDCCGSKKDDKKNDETDTKNVKQNDTQESHGGCCGGNPWAMVVMIIFMAIILYLTYRR